MTKLFQTYNFTQIIDEPTRTMMDTETLTDHIMLFTNRPDVDLEYGVIACSISDHDALYVTRLLKQKIN